MYAVFLSYLYNNMFGDITFANTLCTNIIDTVIKFTFPQFKKQNERKTKDLI